MTRVALSKVASTVPLDFTADDGMVYWADINKNRIHRVNVTQSSSKIETILDTAIESPQGFAIDWLSKNMFIGSSGPNQKQISVCNVDGEFLMPIITDRIYRIESMAVDPYEGRIFWSDVGDDLHTIEMATMLGTDREILSSQKDNKFLNFPTSLVYDPVSKRLYWTNKNSQTIQLYDFPSKSVNKLLEGGELSLPTAITVYKDFLYYYDASNSNIYKTNKYTGSGRTLIQSNIDDVKSLKVFDKESRIGSNACSNKYKRCGHLCIPMAENERQCRCAVGYTPDIADTTVCIGEEGVLIYSTDLGLNGLSLDHMNEENVHGETNQYLPPISQVGVVSRLDLHADLDLLIWADAKEGTITSIQRDGTRRNTLLLDKENIDGLAVDWIANNVYWSNPKDRIIELCRLTGSERFVVVAKDLKKPGALAVHPVRGFLFWVDLGTKVKIERSALDGTSRTVIADSNLGFPIDMSIDYKRNILYFVDRDIKFLEMMYLDGSSRELIYMRPMMRPFGVFVFEDKVYASFRNKSSSAIYSFETGSKTPTVVRNLNTSSLQSLVVMSHNAQTGINKCVNNGGCSELCFFTGTQSECKCFHGKLSSDGVTCKGKILKNNSPLNIL